MNLRLQMKGKRSNSLSKTRKKGMNSINVPLLQLVTRESNRDHVPRVGSIEKTFFILLFVWSSSPEKRSGGWGMAK
jgi:hypothetical protein